MSFVLGKNKSVVVSFEQEGENLIGITLDDGTILYADGYESHRRQLTFPVDLLPEDVRLDARIELENILTSDDEAGLDDILNGCVVHHWDGYSTQNNVYYDSKVWGWRIECGKEMPGLTFYTNSLGRRGEDGFGSFRYEALIKDVFVTTRQELNKG